MRTKDPISPRPVARDRRAKIRVSAATAIGGRSAARRRERGTYTFVLRRVRWQQTLTTGRNDDTTDPGAVVGERVGLGRTPVAPPDGHATRNLPHKNSFVRTGGAC